MYKQKEHKMLPTNILLFDDVNLNRASSSASILEILKMTKKMIPHESRLISEYLIIIKIDNDFLSPIKR